MKRYFLIFYTGNLDKGQQIGNVTHVSSEYPNCNQVVKWLKEQNPETISFVITNIIELNEVDFNKWSDNN